MTDALAGWLYFAVMMLWAYGFGMLLSGAWVL